MRPGVKHTIIIFFALLYTCHYNKINLSYLIFHRTQNADLIFKEIEMRIEPYSPAELGRILGAPGT